MKVDIPCKGKYIFLTEEDILNLRNAEKRLFDTHVKLRDDYDPIEIFTIQAIIKRFEDENRYSKSLSFFIDLDQLYKI